MVWQLAMGRGWSGRLAGGAGGVGARGAARAFQRVKAPLLWVTPRLVRRTRLTAAALAQPAGRFPARLRAPRRRG